MPPTTAPRPAAARSWIASANGHPDFPIDNLPLGIFSPPGGDPRSGIAIGDEILDLRSVAGAGLLRDAPGEALALCQGAELNAFFAAGTPARRALRTGVASLLDVAAEPRPDLLRSAVGCVMHLPAGVGDYTDFYAGLHHATNVGRLFRPDSPLMPNYKHVPIGYHGRASSIRSSGTPVVRPSGQSKAPDADRPTFGPSKRLDCELELGMWVGPGNALGVPLPIGRASDHVAGYCLLNDWSARDIQPWEYQPLGPFLSKNFHTTVSAWVVMPEALAPFRIAQAARQAGDPEPLAYLLDEEDQRTGALDVELEVTILTPAMRAAGQAPHVLSRSNARHMYWTFAQLLTHHASGGCNMRPGDLLGTGTISGPDPDGMGSLLELTGGGRSPVSLPDGESRTFLEDGDEVALKARCRRDGYASIGFGDCRATVRAAVGST